MSMSDHGERRESRKSKWISVDLHPPMVSSVSIKSSGAPALDFGLGLFGFEG